MSKVDLDKVILGHSDVSDSVYVGIPNKKGNMWLQKKDVTQHFIACVIKRWENQEELIQEGENQWKITVEKLR